MNSCQVREGVLAVPFRVSRRGAVGSKSRWIPTLAKLAPLTRGNLPSCPVPLQLLKRVTDSYQLDEPARRSRRRRGFGRARSYSVARKTSAREASWVRPLLGDAFGQSHFSRKFRSGGQMCVTRVTPNSPGQRRSIVICRDVGSGNVVTALFRSS